MLWPRMCPDIDGLRLRLVHAADYAEVNASPAVACDCTDVICCEKLPVQRYSAPSHNACSCCASLGALYS